jgi:hypothetical protein
MPPRKLLPKKVSFRETPEWQRNVSTVLALKKRGFDESQINAVSQLDHMVVRKILEEEEVNKVLIKEAWANKTVLMRDVVGMGLNGIKEVLKEMIDPEVRRQMIRGIPDLAGLTKIVEQLSMLLRLEEGKSTSNIATQHTYQETRIALQELSRIDPVFEYNKELPPVKVT